MRGDELFLAIIFWIVLQIVVFLILRGLVLWYFKIDQIVHYLKIIAERLEGPKEKPNEKSSLQGDDEKYEICPKCGKRSEKRFNVCEHCGGYKR